MFKIFYPDEYADSAYSIDLKKYYDKGFRALILDVDNTLVEHGAPFDDKSVAFFEKARMTGFKTCIISNNDDARVAPFAKGVGSTYIADAKKPATKGYVQAMEKTGGDKDNTLFIGDQIFTDIYGAKKAGIYCILVRYIKYDHEFQIKLKRLGEKIILYFYFKSVSNN